MGRKWFFIQNLKIFRYIVSKKKCRTLDLQKDFKLGIHEVIRMMQLEQANVDIEVRKYTYVSKTEKNFQATTNGILQKSYKLSKKSKQSLTGWNH